MKRIELGLENAGEGVTMKITVCGWSAGTSPRRL
jgi:hypothetical protein